MGSRLKNTKGGGINHLHRLLGMRSDDVIPADAVFVSLDLEVDEWRKKLWALNREPKVGHVGYEGCPTWTFPAYDLSFIRKLGIDIASIAPVLTILDTHIMSRCLFYPYSRLLPVAHWDGSSLAGLLARFEYRPARGRFHNAANDAEYTLHALLLMAAKSGEERRQELGPVELGIFWKLEKIVPWWKDCEEYPVRLSEGLRDVATRVLTRQDDDDGPLSDYELPPLF
ncbi:uncharacterized protein PG986_008284 [Apiospora aurea]|uniref:Gfd2/YDR514C-like C-terminal domain-containing protein n=1 Tax=Apiospora aurea TaxID=335848 RepID=A0ABR1QEY9_9PEZI